MANRRDGGHVVIEISDTGRALEVVGLNSDGLASWNHDKIADGFKNYADPGISFTRQEIEYDSKSVVVLRVQPFEEVPTICKRSYQPPGSKDQVLWTGAL